MFSAGGRAEGKGGLDLYISVRREDVWSSARPLGEALDNGASPRAISPPSRRPDSEMQWRDDGNAGRRLDGHATKGGLALVIRHVLPAPSRAAR